MPLRQRKGKKSLNAVVQELDAFPKVPETYVEQTASGATITLATLGLVCLLVWSEAVYFWNPGFKFKFLPDADYEAKLTINIDMTVAMPCESVGADILDSTNQNTFSFGRLKEESTWFELDHNQRRHFDEIQNFNRYLREEYHAVQDIMWQSGRSSFFAAIPARREVPNEPHDACRVYGSLSLNKVSGNFHITAGKSIPLMRGHAHLSGFMNERDYNFSHRIDRFSFGSGHVGMVHPLEGDEKIADKNFMNYQYFIQVVPTDIQRPSGLTYSTYQYSVKDQERPIEHETGSHGVPGIYFKYDVSALKIKAFQDREPMIQFLIRLCAGVGGLVATSQLICGCIKSIIDFYCCKRVEMLKKASISSPVKASTGLLINDQRIANKINADESSSTSDAVKQNAVTLQEVERLMNK